MQQPLQHFERLPLHPVWEFALKDTLETLGREIEVLRQRQQVKEVW